MIGESASEALFIRFWILFFRYMPVLYVVSFASTFFSPTDSNSLRRLRVVLLVLLVAELLFFISVYAPHKKRLRRAALHPVAATPGERKALFEKCVANTSQPEKYIKWWFLGADLKDIRHDNLREFFLWAFFDMDMQCQGTEDIAQDVWQELDEYIALTEQQLGLQFREGKGPAKCLRLTLDDIHSTYRCLLWYFIMFLLDMATHAALSWHGFCYYARSFEESSATFPPRPQELFATYRSPVPKLGYWFKPHSCPTQRPLIFWHGIGVGLWTYVPFLIQLSTTAGFGDVGLIVPEMLSISFRLTQPLPRKDELLEMVAKILDHHRQWENFTLISHSYGSVPTTHMLHSPILKRRVAAIVLIDPVTILLHLPDVAYNFTRRPPKRANEWQLWYFASTDLGVAHSLGRLFFWRENILWREDVVATTAKLTAGGPAQSTRRKVAVSLSARDLIVDAASVAAYLTSKPQIVTAERAIGVPEDYGDMSSNEVDVMVFPDLDHAQVFDWKYARDRLVRLIHSYGGLDGSDAINIAS
ncbi:hypothetical protein E4U17_002546 [Claviceps sp. LM77 group G4]|nr:hypothetical protein E4U17_002546 [Claviceps sp. LM77 group G4]KAG6069810.1 hypothetical protein E4U33_004621 [Claviceps sp. LM78 group G4]KAG6076360.1 hypothetical protein E4U16_002806 [Claviceps sp. LM84 group G4]